MKRGQALIYINLVFAVIGVLFLILLLAGMELTDIIGSIPGVKTRPKKVVTAEEVIEAPRKTSTGVNSFLKLSTSRGSIRDVLRNYFIYPGNREDYKNIFRDKMEELFAKRVEMKIGGTTISNDVNASGGNTTVSRTVALPGGETETVTFKVWYREPPKPLGEKSTVNLSSMYGKMTIAGTIDTVHKENVVVFKVKTAEGISRVKVRVEKELPDGDSIVKDVGDVSAGETVAVCRKKEDVPSGERPEEKVPYCKFEGEPVEIFNYQIKVESEEYRWEFCAEGYTKKNGWYKYEVSRGACPEG